MSCPTIQTINDTECIGASLPKINSNFATLEVAVCNLTNSQITINDSPTIDLSLTNNNILSADVKDSSITTEKIAPGAVRYSQLATWQELSASPTLSAEAITPKLIVAYAEFLTTSTAPYVSAFDGYNISSVVWLAGTGYGSTNAFTGWKLNFAKPLKTNRYLVFCGDYTSYNMLDSGNTWGETPNLPLDHVIVASSGNGYRIRTMIISKYE